MDIYIKSTQTFYYKTKSMTLLLEDPDMLHVV